MRAPKNSEATTASETPNRSKKKNDSIAVVRNPPARLSIANSDEIRTTIGTGGHAPALAAGAPILVLDMFEHACALDYGTAHAKYIDAFFANLNWGVLEKRWQAARK